MSSFTNNILPFVQLKNEQKKGKILSKVIIWLNDTPSLL